MNKNTATAIVKSINPSIDDTLMSEMLESSKGIKSGQPAYRPYIVGARSLAMNPPQGDLKKGDTAEWFDWERRINQIMESQFADDQTITDIPSGWLTTTININPLSAMISSVKL